MSHAIQLVAHHDIPVTSPVFSANGELMTISITGEIFRYTGVESVDGVQVDSWGNSSGQPAGLAMDQASAYVCDAAHQAIFRIARVEADDGVRQEVEPYVRDYEGQALLGPNSLTISKDTGMIFFTDSGPMGETSLSNPKGSVFAIHGTTQLLIPLTLQSLAHPAGIALSPEGTCLYVAETCKNRVLRYVRRPTNVWHMSVFHQLSGRFGPSAICCASNGDVYIAHFDFGDERSENGRILVLDQEGEVTAIMSVPGPEITGLCLTPDESFLIITESTTASVYRHALR
jgi:sugar lactone lactonase YvrE